MRPGLSSKSLALIVIMMTGFFSAGSMAQDVLTWKDCVLEAAKNSPELQSAEKNVYSYEDQSKGSHSNFLPQVAGGVNYNYGSGLSNFSGTAGDTLSTSTERRASYSASITVNQNLFDGFHDAAFAAGARANLKQARANLDTVKAKVSYDLKSAFANVVYSQRLIKLAKDTIQRRQDNLSLVELLFEGGRENKGSVLLSAAHLKQAVYDSKTAADSLKINTSSLAKVMGREPNENIRIDGDIPIHTPPDHQISTAEIVPETPSYIAAVGKTQAADASVKIAQSAFFPKMDLSGVAGRQGNELNLSEANNRWLITWGLNVPLFNGARDYYATRSAKENYAAARFNQSNTGNTVAVTLEQTLTSYKEAEEKVDVDRSFLEAAKVREEIARAKYENGLLSFEDFDIIENEYINREKIFIQSQRDRVIAEAAWEQAQGKGAIP